MNLEKPYLIMMVGLSGSGKTKKAYELAKQYNAKVLSSDEFRKNICGDTKDQTQNNKVFKLLHEKIFEHLKNQESVIYDATNISLKYRTLFFKSMKEHNIAFCDIITCAYVMTSSVQNCQKQDYLRDDIIENNIIKKQLYKFEIPFFEEGFDYIWLEGYNDNNEKNHKCKLYNRMSLINIMNSNIDDKINIFNHGKITKKYIKSEINQNYILEAALFHDIGKLYSPSINKNISHPEAYHAQIGTYMLLQNLDVLQLNNYTDILKTLCIINYHTKAEKWTTDENTRNKNISIFGIELYNILTIFNKANQKSKERGGE